MMESTESGDELGTSFLHSDPQAFLVQDDMDGMITHFTLSIAFQISIQTFNFVFNLCN